MAESKWLSPRSCFEPPEPISTTDWSLPAISTLPERDFHPEHSHFSVREAVSLLESTAPGNESLVVCHGDYCPPNVLLEDWDPVGFLDLGELGVADRWWDLAIATWSLDWNLGPGYEGVYLDEYEIERDDRRISFYRLLYDLTS